MVGKAVSDISKQTGCKMRNIIRDSGNTLESSLSLLGLNNTSTLSQYLNGIRTISLDLLVAFCKSFNLSPNEILGFQEIVANNTQQAPIDWQLIANLFDTLDYFLKSEKATMSEADRLKLVQFLYENKTAKENIVQTIRIWQVANPSIFKKTG